MSALRLVFLGSTSAAKDVEAALARVQPAWTTSRVESAAALGDRLRLADVDAALAEASAWLTMRELADALASAPRPCPLVVLVREGTPPQDVVALVRDGASEVVALGAPDDVLAGAVALALDRVRGRAGDPLAKAARLQALGELTGGITHDLNNLLAIASTFVELARDGLDEGDPALADLDEAHGALSRAAGLTRRVVSFLRRDRDSVRPIDLTELVHSIERLVTCALGSRITLALDLAPRLPTVVGDPAELEQVLLNLVINARDAITERGTVTIRTRTLGLDAKKSLSDTVGSRVVLSVTDDGAGMDEETQRAIFEPFFTTKERGTGLGLSTVQQIVRRHRGVVRVRSAPGAGSTFEVHLPTSVRSRSSRPA